MKVSIRIQQANPHLEDLFFANNELVEKETTCYDILNTMIEIKKNNYTITSGNVTIYKKDRKILIKYPALTKDFYNRTLNVWILTEIETATKNIFQNIEFAIKIAKIEIDKDYKEILEQLINKNRENDITDYNNIFFLK